MSQQRPVEPQTWTITAGSAAFYWVREVGPVSGVLCIGGAGNGTFLVPEEITPAIYSNAEIFARGGVPWANNRFIPLTWERVGVLVNQVFTLPGSATPPGLLLYSREFVLPWTPG